MATNSTRSINPRVLSIQLVASWTLLGFQNVREGSSQGVMRQCLQLPASFHYLCKMMPFPQDIFKLKYTIMPFNIDMQVHYFVHSVEGCSVLK